MPVRLDLAGQVFQRLTALSYVKGSKRQHAAWLCVCKCGNKRIVPTGALRSGNSKSCGCLSIELSAQRGRENATHGHRRNGKPTSEYASWISMRDRCSNPNSQAWNNYGGRGIKVCKEWAESFMAFYNDMGPRPRKGYDLSRIDNNGNYEPSNCRWDTRAANIRNTRVNVMVEINGVTKCASQWAAEHNLERHAVSRRYGKGERGEKLLRRSRKWRMKTR